MTSFAIVGVRQGAQLLIKYILSLFRCKKIARTVCVQKRGKLNKVTNHTVIPRLQSSKDLPNSVAEGSKGRLIQVLPGLMARMSLGNYAGLRQAILLACRPTCYALTGP